MRAADVPLHELPTKYDWDEAVATRAGGAELVVDGLLGTGIRGPARGPVAGAICYINELSSQSLVVAVDVPSGLNTDTGCAEGDTVRADITATMGFPKRGLVESDALDYVGNIEVVDIGIPQELADTVDSDLELITAADLFDLVSRRHRAVHKGTFGHALVLGGAAGYVGAIAMATRAALRSGTGLVSALVPATLASTVAALAPEAMVHAGAETAAHALAGDALAQWRRPLAGFEAVLIGPGLTPSEESRRLVERVVAGCTTVLVLDADALTVCGGRLDLIRSASCSVILTPHPGEMARLLGLSVSDVQADRRGTARRVAEETGAVVVLKGAGTVVVAPGGPVHVNMTGNPGMATGGMGDVLAGLMTGLAAQGLSSVDAARLAVYLHGRAADTVAGRTARPGIIATDVIEELASVFRDVTLR